MSGDGQSMGKSVEAFDRLRTLLAEPDRAFRESPESYLDALDPFLLNPRFRPHVDLIVRTAFNAAVMATFGRMVPSFLLRGTGRRIAKQLADEVEQRREELLRSVVAPAEVSIAFPPLRRAETPAEYSDQSLRVLLVEARIAVHPTPGFAPASVLVRTEVGPGTDVQFLASYPETDFSAVGTYDIELGANGRFLQKASTESTLNASVGRGPLKAGGSAAESGAAESERTDSSTVKFQYTARATKVVSSAVGQTARWQLMRTEDQLPVGGLTLYATLLAPAAMNNLTLTTETVVDVDGWGPLKLPHRATLAIPRIAAGD